MSESFVNPIFGEQAPRPAAVAVPTDAPAGPVAVETTGQPDVDAVVRSLDGLDDLPVAEHVAVFEQAHESLRRTLAGTNGQQAGRS
jgi:hypothetical protein